MRKTALLSLLLVLLFAPRAHAFGISLSLGEQTAHILDGSGVSSSLLGASARLTLRWEFDSFALATSFGLQRYDVQLSSGGREFGVLEGSSMEGDHSLHLWWTVAGEQEGTHAFLGAAFGIGTFEMCTGDVCSGIGLRPAFEAGVRTLLGKKTNLFVLFSMAGLVGSLSEVVLLPGLSMGIEL